MPNNTAQRRSRSLKLPVEDLDFLLRDEMRDIRFALEYAKAELLLRDWGIRSTIIVFGSARTPSPEQAEAAMAAATTDAERARAPAHAAALGALHARRASFGRIISERGGAFAPQRSLARQRRRHRRRAGHHGGGQSRRLRCRRAEHRLQHHAAEGAAAQCVHRRPS